MDARALHPIAMATSSTQGGQLVLSNASSSNTSPNRQQQQSTGIMRGLINSTKSLFERSRVGLPEDNPPEYDVYLPVYLAGVQILQPFESGLCKILDQRHLFNLSLIHI